MSEIEADTHNKKSGENTLSYTSRERSTIFFFAFLGILLDGAQLGIMIYFLSAVASYFNVSITYAAIIQTSSFGIGIIGGSLFGWLSDKRGRRISLTATIALFSIFTLASAFATSFGMLLAFRIIAGIGIGGESGIAFAYLNEAYSVNPKHRGFVGGLLQSMFIVGSFVTIVLYQFTSLHYGANAWRYAQGLLGIGAIVALFARIFMPESKLWLASIEHRNARKEVGSSLVTKEPLLEIFSRRWIKLTVLTSLLMLFAFGIYIEADYTVTMWLTIYKLSINQVTEIGYTMSLISFLAYILGGHLADVIGRKRTFVLFSIVDLVGYAIFWLYAPFSKPVDLSATVWSSPVLYSILILSAGLGMFGAWGSWLGELFPTHLRATGENVAYYIGRGISGGILPIAALTLALAYGLDVRFAMGLGIMVPIGVLAIAPFLRETRGTILEAN